MARVSSTNPIIRTISEAPSTGHCRGHHAAKPDQSSRYPATLTSTTPIARPKASPRPPSRGVAPLWIRRKWSGRSIAPAQSAIRVTTGVASTHPMKATAKISSKELEIIMEGTFLTRTIPG